MRRLTHFVEDGLAVRLDDVLAVIRDETYSDAPYRVFVRGADVAIIRLSEEAAVDLFAALRKHRG